MGPPLGLGAETATKPEFIILAELIDKLNTNRFERVGDPIMGDLTYFPGAVSKMHTSVTKEILRSTPAVGPYFVESRPCIPQHHVNLDNKQSVALPRYAMAIAANGKHRYCNFISSKGFLCEPTHSLHITYNLFHIKTEMLMPPLAQLAQQFYYGASPLVENPMDLVESLAQLFINGELKGDYHVDLRATFPSVTDRAGTLPITIDDLNTELLLLFLYTSMVERQHASLSFYAPIHTFRALLLAQGHLLFPVHLKEWATSPPALRFINHLAMQMVTLCSRRLWVVEPRLYGTPSPQSPENFQIAELQEEVKKLEELLQSRPPTNVLLTCNVATIQPSAGPSDAAPAAAETTTNAVSAHLAASGSTTSEDQYSEDQYSADQTSTTSGGGTASTEPSAPPLVTADAHSSAHEFVLLWGNVITRYDLDNDNFWEGFENIAVPIDPRLRDLFSAATDINALSEEVDKTDRMSDFYALPPDQPWFSQVFTKMDWDANVSKMLKSGDSSGGASTRRGRSAMVSKSEYNSFIDLLVTKMARIEFPNNTE